MTVTNHSLGEICLAIVDCEHKTAPVDECGSHFAVGTPAMKGNVIDYAEARRISLETYGAWTKRTRPCFGDLLLAREAPVGPVVRIPAGENVAAGQRTVVLRPDPTCVDSSYLYYLLTSPAEQERLGVKAAGSTVPHLNVADVRTYVVGLRPLREQRAIAEVLGALDDKIAANARTRTLAVDLAVTLTSGPEPSVSLASIATFHKRTVTPTEITAARVHHYSLPAFDDARAPEVVPPATIKSNKYLVEAPSVLVSKLNPRFPRVWNVLSPEALALASTEFLVMQPTHCTSSVLWSILSRPDFSQALQANVAGTSGSHQRVRPSDVLNTFVVDPTRLPRTVHDQITGLGMIVHAMEAESLMLAAMRDALLPKLMSGELRVREAEQVAEEVL